MVAVKQLTLAKRLTATRILLKYFSLKKLLQISQMVSLCLNYKTVPYIAILLE